MANKIQELMANWASRADFAQDVGRSLDVVHKWAQMGRIPAPDQAAVVDAARRRGLTQYTAEWLLSVHDRRTDAA